MSVRRAGPRRLLELLVANRGNVTERLDRRRVTITLRRAGVSLSRLHPVARDVRPRTRGLVEFRYRGRVHGPVTALVELTREPGNVVRRTFRLRL